MGREKPWFPLSLSILPLNYSVAFALHWLMETRAWDSANVGKDELVAVVYVLPPDKTTVDHQGKKALSHDLINWFILPQTHSKFFSSYMDNTAVRKCVSCYQRN